MLIAVIDAKHQRWLGYILAFVVAGPEVTAST